MDTREQLERERDYYLRLLQLGEHDEIDGLLREALDLVVGLTGARIGYLGLGSPKETLGWASDGCGPVERSEIRAMVSSGIISTTFEQGRPLVTSSATEDPRFAVFPSVRRQAIEAVICAPIGQPPLGFVYLQGEAARMPTAASDEVQRLARTLVPLADRLLMIRERRQADPTLALRLELRAEELIGRSEAMARMLKRLRAASGLDIDVMITGPTGAGKNAVALALHRSSARAKGPFVVVPCPGVTSTLFESELFGALRGSYTGAERNREGFVAAAEGGTLVLDEITEIGLPQQAKLLHFLQTRQFFPVGGTTPRDSHVRIVACTNLDPERAIAEGRLRADLYFRLRRFRVTVPALAERAEDIGLLAAHLLELACRDFGVKPLELRPAATRLLQRMDWPGNVRELRATLEEAAALAVAEGSESVGPEHLLDRGAAPVEEDCPPGFHEATWWFQARHIQSALERCEGNRSQAARDLGMSRSHLHTLLARLGLDGAP